MDKKMLLRKLLYVLVISFLPFSCSSDDEDIEEPIAAIEYPEQKPILGDSVRVVVLGNSFSVDATAYLNDLVMAAGLDTTRMCVYNGCINGGSFADWLELYQTGEKKTFTKMAGGGAAVIYEPVSDVLKRPWDVCVLVQSSAVSYSWSSFETVAEQLVALVRTECPNKQITLAYAMPWSHTVKSHPREWKGNIDCAIKMSQFYGVRVIPVGTAVQNARDTRLENGMYLTRDNWHLCHGVGRYIAACTWFQVLFGDAFHVSVLDNTAIHPLTEAEAGETGSVAVDDTNRRLCQQCACEAVKSPFAISDLQE